MKKIEVATSSTYQRVPIADWAPARSARPPRPSSLLLSPTADRHALRVKRSKGCCRLDSRNSRNSSIVKKPLFRNTRDSFGLPGMNSACVAIWMMCVSSDSASSNSLLWLKSWFKAIFEFVIAAICFSSCSTKGSDDKVLNFVLPANSFFFALGLAFVRMCDRNWRD